MNEIDKLFAGKPINPSKFEKHLRLADVNDAAKKIAEIQGMGEIKQVLKKMSEIEQKIKGHS